MIVRKHRDHDITGTERFDFARHLSLRAGDGLRFLHTTVEQHDFVPRLDQVRGHARSHLSETCESDVHDAPQLIVHAPRSSRQARPLDVFDCFPARVSMLKRLQCLGSVALPASGVRR